MATCCDNSRPPQSVSVLDQRQARDTLVADLRRKIAACLSFGAETPRPGYEGVGLTRVGEMR
ncbi:MAG TPA: hypothetical protein VLA12_04575, partial [Planctomycetaceae bacterium]|nr:hypothetical protein [Planctomycetaceae bacterium]